MSTFNVQKYNRSYDYDVIYFSTVIKKCVNSVRGILWHTIKYVTRWCKGLKN